MNDNEKLYTLIIYVSSGSTHCMGCLMEQWGSSFDVFCGLSRDKIPGLIARAKDKADRENTDSPEWQVFEGSPVSFYADDEFDSDVDRVAKDLAEKRELEAALVKEKEKLQRLDQMRKQVAFLQAELEKEETRQGPLAE